MVAVLSPNSSIRQTLYYNENKVKAQVAVCLMAENFPKAMDALQVQDKLQYLQKLAAMNTKTKVNCLHVHLNLDPSERLTDEKLQEITNIYMEQIGFGNQPYLAYQHFDAAHPHVHIVTTNIEMDGRRIDLHHLGIRCSEPARKAIEEQFGLVKAEEQGQKNAAELKPADPERVVYGRSETRKSIANVLAAVLRSYKYTSLPELNAVLKLYNVMADRGEESSRIYRHRGLIYHALDPDGKPVGVPIKASNLPGKPGLKSLEERFKLNEPLRQMHKFRMKNAIEMILKDGSSISLDGLLKELEKAGINVVLRRNDAGLIYGITYVDHTTKCVFNGSTLGKSYSANAIQTRCGMSVQHQNRFENKERAAQESLPGAGLWDALLQEESIRDDLPFDLKRRRKKKKQKQIDTNQSG